MKKVLRFLMIFSLMVLLVAAFSGCGGGGGDSASLSSAKTITAFSFKSPAATGNIDENEKTIAVTVPNGTDVAALIATFTTTGTTVEVGGVEQVSGTTPNDFTGPVAYTVTAEDNSVATYIVTVTADSSSSKSITAFSFASPAALGIIDESAKAIAVYVPHDTDVTVLIATFTMNGASVKVGDVAQVSGTTPNDFTNPVIYTVTAEDSTTVTYTVTVTVAAIALAKTGQTNCYDDTGAVIACANTGQDGELQKGAAWPNSRFTANADTSITDNLTGLAWAQNRNIMAARDAGFDNDSTAGDGCVTWQHALDYVAKLNAENYLGHNDWRLPNNNELRSLVNYDATDLPAWLAAQGFSIGNQSFLHWSSTTAGTNYAWNLDIDYGGVLQSGPKANLALVWPVRGGQGDGIPADQPKTGQTICYDTAGSVIACANTGQDGDLQKGTAWPNPRFATLGDTTVADNLTGLIWAPDGNIMPARDSGWDQDMTANNGEVFWQHALDYVAKLNAENYLGHNDWRLPNVNEMASLVNAGQLAGSDSPAKWLNTQGFSNVQADFYWTSTTWTTTNPFNINKDAWFVNMLYGSAGRLLKASNQLYVWPVRGGQ